MRIRWHVCSSCGRRFRYRYEGASALQELHGIDFVCGECLDWALAHPKASARRVLSVEVAPGVAAPAPWRPHRSRGRAATPGTP